MVIPQALVSFIPLVQFCDNEIFKIKNIFFRYLVLNIADKTTENIIGHFPMVNIGHVN